MNEPVIQSASASVNRAIIGLFTLVAIRDVEVVVTEGWFQPEGLAASGLDFSPVKL